jgi:hypothetical protein
MNWKRWLPLICSLVTLVLLFALDSTGPGTFAKAASCFITAGLYFHSYQQQWAGPQYKFDLLPGVLWLVNGFFQTIILAALRVQS